MLSRCTQAMNKLILTLGLFHWQALLSIGYAQSATELRTSIADTVSIMGEYEFVDMDAIGPGGTATTQLNRFIYLLENATIEELLTLTNHNMRNVRAYAFWSLAIKRHNNIKQVLESKLTDNKLIRCRLNCTNITMPLNRFYLSVLSPESKFMHGTTLTQAEILEFQSKMGK